MYYVIDFPFIYLILSYKRTIYSAIALSKLFLSGDPRIQGIQVKGDLIVTNSSSMYYVRYFIIKIIMSTLRKTDSFKKIIYFTGIMTRSRSRKSMLY